MESTPEQTAEGVAIVRVLASVLDRLVNANSVLAQQDGNVTKFHALKAPNISVLQYLERIHKLIQRNNFLLTHLNVHRVIISSVLVAAKFFDDAYYNNAYYAKVGGVMVSELNSLEVEFLFRINFCLHVTPELYRKYHDELLSHATGCESMAEVAAVLLSAKANLVAAGALRPSSLSPQVAASQQVQQQPMYPKTAQQRIITPSPPVTSPAHDYYGYDASNLGRVPREQHPQCVQASGLPPDVVSNLSRQLQHQHAPVCATQQQYMPFGKHGVYPSRVDSATISVSDMEESDQQYYGVPLQQQQPLVQGYSNAAHGYPVYVPSTASTPCPGPPLPHHPIKHPGGYATVHAAPRLATNNTSSFVQQQSCSPHQAHLSTHFVVTTTGGGVS